MLFNSFGFAGFFIIVYILYLRLGHVSQNRLLLLASYLFYSAWDWRFLSLILISTFLGYFCGLKIGETSSQDKRKWLLRFSIFGNLVILVFFKYFNFFASNLQLLFNQFGLNSDIRYLNIVLPVGISFYTFQVLSYTIDVYRGDLQPTEQFLDFALFVAFFPKLLAGPIEKASHLLPQILNPRRLNLEDFYQGCYLIFWGLFLKVFVGDNLKKLVDPIFSSVPPYNGQVVLLASYAFAFQIFSDFCGYSNIARGLGKLMGFDIMINFNLPYFVTNPRDFWQRWHISLSNWLRDYLYIPLGGNRKGNLKTYRNLFLTMFLGGLWHGAAWTYIIWGTYHGILLIAHRILLIFRERFSAPASVIIRKLWFLVKVAFFFHLICLGWLIFRAQSISQIFDLLHSLLFIFSLPAEPQVKYLFWQLLFFTWLLLIVQLMQYFKNDLLAVFNLPISIKIIFYVICYYLMIIYGVTGGKEFVYLQF